jgi:4-amino-4-deoxy-L-arabinose transferase-like glycosyltransferase
MKNLEKPWLVALLALVFFVPFLGNVHLFDWDEINFAESAREMLITGRWLRVQIDFQPFWEKPPLFFWLQAAAMRVWGVNEFAARFPNVVVGVATLLTFFYLGKRWHSPRFGLLWALVYIGSFTPHLYFKSGIIDPTFNYFMFLAVVFLVDNPQRLPMRYCWAGVFAGLAVWTKGPVGVGIPTITLGVLWALNRFKPICSFKNLAIYTLTSGLFTLGWVATIIIESGWSTFLAFLQYLYNLMATSEADHGEPFYYHFVVVLLGCFPMSILGLRAIFGSIKNKQTTTTLKPIIQAQMVLFWTVMIVFSLVKTKIVHYSSMAYFPLSFMATLYVYQWLNGTHKWPRWQLVVMFSIGTILALVLILVPTIGLYPAIFSRYIDDSFVIENLKSPVQWSGYEWLIGVVYALGVWYAVWIWQKHKQRAVLGLLTATATCVFVYSAAVVPKIEGYSQRTMIAFYESKRGQNVYVSPVGFKSYAQYFYFQKPLHSNPKSSDEAWLINGPVDKPTFLISRTDRAAPYRQHPNLQVIAERNGFVFLKRR